MDSWFFGALLVQEVQAFVEGDAVEPRGKLGISPEIVQVGPGLDERVLQQVVGIVVRNHHASYLPVQLFAVGLHNPFERFPLGRRVLKHQYGFFFVIIVHGVCGFVIVE